MATENVTEIHPEKVPLDHYGAFLIGYYTAYAGIPFRAIHILNEIETDAVGARKDVIRSQSERIREHNPETVWYVKSVEALLRDADLFIPPRPYVVATWHEWAIDARRAVAVVHEKNASLLRVLKAGEAYATFAAAVVLDDILLTSRDPSLHTLHDVGPHRDAADEVERSTAHLAEALDGQPTAFVEAAHEVTTAARSLPSLDAPSERARAMRELVKLANSKLESFNVAYRSFR